MTRKNENVGVRPRHRDHQPRRLKHGYNQIVNDQDRPTDWRLWFEETILDFRQAFLHRVDRVFRWLKFRFQVGQDTFVLLDLGRKAARFLAEWRGLGFLSVLACPAFAFGDLLVQTGQFVLGIVELLRQIRGHSTDCGRSGIIHRLRGVEQY